MRETDKQDFQSTVWRQYDRLARSDLPWRRPEADGSFDPYKIIVSELMLQQTQVGRVIPKYQDFLERFPSAAALAAAPLGDVLRAWNGLGYNRRAKFLWQAARQIVNDHAGRFPDNEAELTKLAGIGRATAGAILAYAFDRPAVFVETNVRTVFIHHFFNDRTDIPDKDITKLIKATLPEERCREWYWALMDYGTFLKKTAGNLSRHSRGYAKQSRFEGSQRQLRGRLIRVLNGGGRRLEDLRTEVKDDRLDAVVADLIKEGLIRRRGSLLSL